MIFETKPADLNCYHVVEFSALEAKDAEIALLREKLRKALKLLKQAEGYVFALSQPCDQLGYFNQWEIELSPQIKELDSADGAGE